MQSEKKPKTEVIYCVIPLIWWSGKGKTIDINQMNGCQGLGENMGSIGDEETFKSNGNILYYDYTGGHMTVCVKITKQYV